MASRAGKRPKKPFEGRAGARQSYGAPCPPETLDSGWETISKRPSSPIPTSSKGKKRSKSLPFDKLRACPVLDAGANVLVKVPFVL